MAQTPEEIIKEQIEFNSKLVGHGIVRPGYYQIPYNLMDHLSQRIIAHLRTAGYMNGSKGLAKTDILDPKHTTGLSSG